MPAATRRRPRPRSAPDSRPSSNRYKPQRNVWDAVNDQLDAKYTVDCQADGCGAYIVLWFGNVPRRNLPPHPDGLSRPKTPGELERMLKERLPEARRSSIDIFVIDLSRPAATT